MNIDHKTIESKWAEAWEDTGFHQPDLENPKKPFYNLMMFPYPSAEGLHVGNLFAFVGSDVQGRFMRAKGYDVFEPMGFDAFGMHSENFAIKTGRHPWRMVPDNIAFFRDHQLSKMGIMFDWSTQVDTTDPAYYRWTQWIFLQLYRAGLAYQKMAPVNWCPSCKTVLANEQAAGDVCERCGTGVESRSMNQWFFKITAYADRLLKNLEWIDWSETTRQTQINWIGRSSGAEIDFTVDGTEEAITVFTTRPDTLFGVTYLAIAPDTPTDSEDGKRGRNTGKFARHPISGKKIPIWEADYVVADYGSGAVMGVPAHDERDFDFARKYGIDVVRVIDGECNGACNGDTAYTGEGMLINSAGFNDMPSQTARIEIVAELERLGGGRTKVTYRLRDWCISRQRYWGTPIPMIHCDSCGPVPVPEKDLPVTLPYIDRFKPDGSGDSPLARADEFVRVQCPVCGRQARRETDVSDNFLDSAWYFLRYPSAHDSRVAFEKSKTSTWLPVDLYIGGNEHAVLHLMYTRFVTMVLHDLGHLPFEEPFKRFRANGHIIKDGAKMSKSKGNVINPDSYIERYGADVLRTYLMFFGNYQEGGDFRDSNIIGVRRFLEKVYTYCLETEFNTEEILSRELVSEIHRKIKKVTSDIENLRYNTAISAAMELHSAIITAGSKAFEGVSVLLRLLAPFAPFVAQELWHRLGFDGQIAEAPWPEFRADLILDKNVEFVVQVNGKIRGKFFAPPECTEETAVEMALALPRIAEILKLAEITKTIFVPKRLVSFVVRAVVDA